MVYRRDYRRKRRQGFFETKSITFMLIAINVFFFFLFLIILGIRPDWVNKIAIQPQSFFENLTVWTLITSMFMHGGIFHLFVNMFSLFFLGGLTEKIIGRKRFLWLYMLSGIVGALFFVGFAFLGQYIPRGEFVFGGISDSAVGASGAIFGLLGILAVILPKKQIYLIAGPIIVIVAQFALRSFLPSGIVGTIDLIATVLVFLMIFAIFSSNPRIRRFSIPLKMPFWVTPIVAIVPLIFIGLFVKLPIGNSAHFGGLVVGLIYGFYLRNKYAKKIKILNRVLK